MYIFMCCNPTNFITPHLLYAKVEVTKVGHTLDHVNTNLFDSKESIAWQCFFVMWLIFLNIIPYQFRRCFIIDYVLISMFVQSVKPPKFTPHFSIYMQNLTYTKGILPLHNGFGQGASCTYSYDDTILKQTSSRPIFLGHQS